MCINETHHLAHQYNKIYYYIVLIVIHQIPLKITAIINLLLYVTYTVQIAFLHRSIYLQE